MGLLSAAVGVQLAVVICTPIALSSQDLIGWAAAPTGLGLRSPWPVLVFVALDAAGVCVLLTVYCARRGEPAGIFGVLVWCFAFGSAFANYRHSTTPGAAPDAAWFFPAMSVAGPALLEAVLGRCRRWFQRDTGRRRLGRGPATDRPADPPAGRYKANLTDLERRIGWRYAIVAPTSPVSALSPVAPPAIPRRVAPGARGVEDIVRTNKAMGLRDVPSQS